jgi:hypothetical protein
MVHLRLGTPGYGDGLKNVHPFEAGEQFFVHNGAITPRKHIALLVPPDSGPLTSDTDSERYFRVLQHAAAQHGGSIAAGMGEVLTTLASARLVATSLNAVLLDNAGLNVISCHDPAIPLGDTKVWPDDEAGRLVRWPAYLPLVHAQRGHTHLVTSSGVLVLDGDTCELPNHVVWTAPADGSAPFVEVIPTRPIGAQHSRAAGR